MVDILDVVVPAYKAGITVDLLDYHKINGKKTVDKYVDIKQEQLEEVISYWDDERKVQQATFFASENGVGGRVVVVVMSFNYNYDGAFERGLKLYKHILIEVAAMYECVPESKEDTHVQYTMLRAKERSQSVEPIFMNVQEKDGNPIEALHDMWFGKKEKPEHEDTIDALRYAIDKSLADALGMPVEMLDANYDKLTEAQNEDLKERLRTMAMSGPGDIGKQIEQWREMIISYDISHEDMDKLRERVRKATYETYTKDGETDE